MLNLIKMINSAKTLSFAHDAKNYNLPTDRWCDAFMR